MLKRRIGVVAAIVLASVGAPRSDAQQAAGAPGRPAAEARPADPRDEAVKSLIGRLDLEKYKATIKGLTQFGDRRQGTERNRKALERMANPPASV